MAFFLMAGSVHLIVNTFLAKLLRVKFSLTVTWKPWPAWAMAVKLNGRGWFPQVTWFYSLYSLLAIICCWYITSLSIKVTFTNTAFITPNVITGRTFITLGLKMLLRMRLLLRLGPNVITDGGPLLHLGPIITHVPSSPRNDPDPKMIPNLEMIPEWSPFLFMLTPKWSPINSWNGTCIPSRNYYKSVAEFTFLNLVNISLQIENVTVKNSIFPSSLPTRPRTRLNLIPNRLSSQKTLDN